MREQLERLRDLTAELHTGLDRMGRTIKAVEAMLQEIGTGVRAQVPATKGVFVYDRIGPKGLFRFGHQVGDEPPTPWDGVRMEMKMELCRLIPDLIDALTVETERQLTELWDSEKKIRRRVDSIAKNSSGRRSQSVGNGPDTNEGPR